MGPDWENCITSARRRDNIAKGVNQVWQYRIVSCGKRAVQHLNCGPGKVAAAGNVEVYKSTVAPGHAPDHSQNVECVGSRKRVPVNGLLTWTPENTARQKLKELTHDRPDTRPVVRRRQITLMLPEAPWK